MTEWKLTTITVDKDLEDFLHGVSQECDELLADRLTEDGFRDPIIVWEETGKIVDGHRRYRKWELMRDTQPLNVPRIETKSFASIEDVKKWMIFNQLARRNSNPANQAYMRGCLANLIGPSAAAKQTQTSRRQARRDGKLAKTVDAVASENPEAAKAILSGALPASQVPDDPKKAIAAVQESKDKAKSKARKAPSYMQRLEEMHTHLTASLRMLDHIQQAKAKDAEHAQRCGMIRRHLITAATEIQKWAQNSLTGTDSKNEASPDSDITSDPDPVL